MKNKIKSWTLLLVFCFSLMPFGMGQAEGPVRTFGEARALLYVSDAFLEDEANLDTASHIPGLMAPAPVVRQAEGAEEVLGRMIHATKQERNDHDANCRQLKRRYQSAGDQTAVQKLETYCKAERQRLSNRISFLRRLRGGDRRKVLTRFWHSVKRGSVNLWRRIGPLGRNILRKVGDEAFNTVASGGSLNVGRLVKQVAKSTMRGKLQSMMYDGLARLLTGQLEIARAAGVLEEEEDDGQYTDEDFQLGDLEDGEQDGQEVGQTANQAEEEEDCTGDLSWVAPYWEEVVQPQLIAEGRVCQPTAIAMYKSCLQDQGVQGVCQEEALMACEHLYRSIPRTETGGTVTQKLTVTHSEAQNIAASLVYNGSGGSGVRGNIKYILKDRHLCTIKVTSTLSGSFDLHTCTLSGTAQVTEVFEGRACASVCSEGSCPVTRSASVPWQATLEDGEIFGVANGNKSSVSGFGFMTP